jgi:hypothetical protein
MIKFDAIKMESIQAKYWWWHLISHDGEEPIAIA